jgi:osmotically inducible protein OsmC
MAARTGSATWSGDLRTGSGQLTVGPGRWEAEYSFRSRFNDDLDPSAGATNPEELLAAAHAGCFTMGLTYALAEAGHPPRQVTTRARVRLRPVDGIPTIDLVELDTTVDVTGVEETVVREYAEDAKVRCAISRALAGVDEIRLTARLAAPSTGS